MLAKLWRWAVALVVVGSLPRTIADNLWSSPWRGVSEEAWIWLSIVLLPLVTVAVTLRKNSRHIWAAYGFAALLVVHSIILIGSIDTVPRAEIAIWVDALLGLGLAAWLSTSSEQFIHIAGRSIILWTAAIFGVGVPAAILHGNSVAAKAEAVAGDRPYCIQYASQTSADDHEPALTLFDLSALKMWSRLMDGGMSSQFHFQHHAIMVIDGEKQELLNWSYTKREFVPEVIGLDKKKGGRLPDIACVPKAHYVAHLPRWKTDLQRRSEVRIGGRTFLIPQAFRPALDQRSFIVRAVAPEFAALMPELRPYRWESSSFITVSIGWPEKTADWYYRAMQRWPTSDAPNSDLGMEHGLQKLGTPRRPNWSTYTSTGSDGTLDRIISCRPDSVFHRSNPHCDHRFEADGLSFRLQIKDPAQWREIERRLAALVASWERPPQ